MKKYKICKILLVILAIFLCVAFYELLGICVAYKKQPEVSNTTQKETKNGSWNECSENTERVVIIEKNPEALLQRSVRETYFWYSICLDGQDICFDKGGRRSCFKY